MVVIGLDGLEPSIVEPMLAAAELPALASLRARGGYARLGTTFPPQTPVAWSSFATGTDPGGHGIFDFLRRDPSTYLPDLALNRYEQKSAFVPPRAVNLRGGEPFWDILGRAGIPSVVLRCPCTYPGEVRRGRLLAGLGVPDIRGGLGTTTLYTTRDGVAAAESEQVIPVRFDGRRCRTHVIGPRLPRGGDASAELEIALTDDPLGAELRAGPAAVRVGLGQWSDWLPVKFKVGLLQSAAAIVRFHLVALDPFTLHATPVNFAPGAPLYPISAPWDYAGELDAALGTYYTAGMVEDHTGLMNGRIDEAAFLDQCAIVMREREAMLGHELARFREGFLFCLFDTPDRIQHLFWRFGEPGHPANREPFDRALARVIADHYRACDAVVGRVVEAAGDDALVIVLSDHGFGSFQRGIHLNGWLCRHGYLSLRRGVEPREAGDMLRQVDWDRTSAYALGLGGIYLNRRGREANGILDDDAAAATALRLADELGALEDDTRGARAIRRVVRREEVYHGPYLADAPDLLVCPAPGYRASWATGLGGVPGAVFEDNTRRWGGDHIVDPALVPGVLFVSGPFDGARASMLDLGPTILAAFGIPAGSAMVGRSLFG